MDFNMICLFVEDLVDKRVIVQLYSLFVDEVIFVLQRLFLNGLCDCVMVFLLVKFLIDEQIMLKFIYRYFFDFIGVVKGFQNGNGNQNYFYGEMLIYYFEFQIVVLIFD